MHASVGCRFPPLDMGPCARRHRSGAILGRGAGTSTIRVRVRVRVRVRTVGLWRALASASHDPH
jgi:hypothetical protein